MSTFNLPFSIFIADRKPVDDRYIVSNETERLSIGNGIRAFNGLQIFQQDTKKLYILNDYATSTWVEVGGSQVSGLTNSTNTYIGVDSYNNTTGTNNTFVGVGSGYNNTGSNNVFIGYQSGYNEVGSNKLYISNSNTSNPLIYGEFDNSVLRINGDLYLNGISDSANTHVLYYNNVTSRITYGLQPNATEMIEDYITDVFPVGIKGNTYFIKDDNTRLSEPDFIVKRGLIVENNAELIEAQGHAYTFEQIFNEWYMFSHGTMDLSYINSTYLNKTYYRIATSVTGSGTLATVKLLRHGLISGNVITVSNATPSMYNGTFTITVIDVDTFTYTTLSTITTSPATGSISIGHNIVSASDAPILSPRHFPAFDPLNPYSPFNVESILDKTAWSYNSVSNSIMCTANYNTATGFVSNELFDSYELSVDVSSDASDDDANGVVVAFVKDGITGFEYTLSVVRTYFNIGSIPEYAIMYNISQNRPTLDSYDPNYEESAELVLVDGSHLVNTTGQNWNVAGKTKFWVKRDNDIISVKVGQQGSNSIDDTTLLTYDLKDNPKTHKFRGACKFGFISWSQMNSTFSNLNMSMYGNYIFYNSGTSHHTYIYNNSTSTWSLQTPQVTTAQDYFGVGRIINSYLFNKLYFLNHNGLIEKLTSPSESTYTSPLTTKGDILAYSTTDVRFPLGTQNQILSVDTTTVTGLKWNSVGNLNVNSPLTVNGVRQVIGGDLTISINDASITVKGAVQLSNLYNGTSQVLAVTEKALSDGLSTKQNAGVVSSHASSHISGGGTDVIPNFTSVNSGLVPSSGGGTTNFLRADGSWAAPTFSGSYLPLVGGTLTGDLIISKNQPKLTLYAQTDDIGRIEFWDDDNLRGYIYNNMSDYEFKMMTNVGVSKIVFGLNNTEMLSIDTNSNVTATGVFKSLNIETNQTTQTTRLGIGSGYNEDESTIRRNVFIGHNAGYNTTTGNNNVFIGTESGLNSTIGVGNVAIGDYAGGVINGKWNVFVGHMAGFNATVTSGNTYIGALAGIGNTTGNYNTIIGYGSSGSGSGNENVTIGADCGSSGNQNVSIGRYCTQNVTIGSRNVNIGYRANNGLTDGVDNIAIGYHTKYSGIGNGSRNTVIGNYAGYNNIGSNNVFIGYQSGYNETGSNRLYISNSNTSTPLIYGDFNLNELTINGKFTVTRDIIANSGMTVAGSLSSGNIKFLGENGYTKTTEGLIIQWGTWVSSTDNPLDVAFPYVFPNFCFSVVHNEYCGSNETTVTTSYFTVNRHDDVSGTPTRHFIAIGI